MMQHVVGPLPTAQAPAPDRRAAPPDAEDPTTALHGAMPRDAIVTGAVDYVLRLEEIGPVLVRLTSAAPNRTSAPSPRLSRRSRRTGQRPSAPLTAGRRLTHATLAELVSSHSLGKLEGSVAEAPILCRISPDVGSAPG